MILSREEVMAKFGIYSGVGYKFPIELKPEVKSEPMEIPAEEVTQIEPIVSVKKSGRGRPRK